MNLKVKQLNQLDSAGVNLKKLNGNTLAKAVSIIEGKKIELPIGQIKEVLKCLAVIQATLNRAEYLDETNYDGPIDIIGKQANRIYKKTFGKR